MNTSGRSALAHDAGTSIASKDVGRIQERSEQSAAFSTAKDWALAQQTARHLASAHE
jgi:hypothetical protein